ncbi:ABC transporter permease [Kineosporia succinea]|uniref:ABC-2 type transport system permease protein n=1 Tax=Kineosporia succinea TaxID=84632 RepID=A0ABT9PDL3_9ACTN|nr:ABC transporter permease [Kineosporia succinea]MDP9830801.1 ABC-2 type transport system permease protein [Kineosporia succinea]
MSATFSVPRTLHLARWNTVLLTRNKLAVTYALVMPLAPLLLLLMGERGAETTGASAIGSVLLLAVLFPVFYNILSQFVSRRDELVLKRMRTGEARDGELLAGIALPGIGIALLVSAIAVPIAIAAGQMVPVNALLFALAAVLAVVMFAAFAYWTAAWTRSAEAAQLTSIPVIVLASLGPFVGGFPGLSDTVREAISLTPGAAMTELIRVGWFGLENADATTSTLAFVDTWSAAGQPVVVMLFWTALALDLARRSMRWEPRT